MTHYISFGEFQKIISPLKSYFYNFRYRKCDGYIQDLEDGKLRTQPGCTEEETLEVWLSLFNCKNMGGQGRWWYCIFIKNTELMNMVGKTKYVKKKSRTTKNVVISTFELQ